MNALGKTGRCRRCRRRAILTPVSRLCAACLDEHLRMTYLVENAVFAGNQRSVEGIAEYAGLPVAEVKRIVKETRVFDTFVRVPRPCARCAARNAEPGSQFCVHCAFELRRLLEQAQGSLAATRAARAQRARAMSPPSGVVAALDEKRERTPAMGRPPKTPRVKG